MFKKIKYAFLTLMLLGSYSITSVNIDRPLNKIDNKITNKVNEVQETRNIDNYFGDLPERAPTLSREELFNELQELVWDGWKSQSYDDLYQSLKDVEYNNGRIVDIYSSYTNFSKNETCGNYSNEGDCWNREHLIPKSRRGGNKGGPNGEGGDMFNMYATDGKVNGMRSNYPLGETNAPTYESKNGFSKLGPSSFNGYKGTVFEINDIYKGNVARSYFYFALKYVTYTNSNYTSGNGAVVFNKNGNFGLTDYSTDLFLDWNKHLETNDWEITRAERIYNIQNNLNPFIYYPEWADYIWGNIPLSNTPSINMETNINLEEGKTYKLNPKLTNISGNINFYSENNNIATVDNNGLITGINPGKTNIIASISSVDTTLEAICEVNIIERIEVENVIITGTNIINEGIKGETTTLLKAKVNYKGVEGNNNVSWSSLTPHLAKVDENGLVTFLDNGKVEIKAISIEDNTKFDTFEINVSNLENQKGNIISTDKFNSIEGNLNNEICYKSYQGGGTSIPQINKEEIRLYQNSSGNGGGYITISSKSLNIKAITFCSSTDTSFRFWEEDNDKSETISLNMDEKYTINNLNSKNVSIQCMGKTKSQRLYLNYLAVFYGEVESTEIKVNSFKIHEDEMTLEVGDEEILFYEILPNDATNKNISWTSSDDSIVSVKNALIKALKPGEVIITAITESGLIKDSCKIYVLEEIIEPTPIPSISFEKDNLTIEIGETQKLNVILKNIEGKVNFESLNNDIVIIDELGNIKGINVGSTIVKAKINDLEATCKVEVINKIVEEENDPNNGNKDNNLILIISLSISIPIIILGISLLIYFIIKKKS